jgi:hypothetical protein
MTSNPNPKREVPNLNTGASNTPTPANAPSVPISVYRQLAAELQATKVMLDSLNGQNQQLTQQNQQLRREIDKIVQSALYLQQIAESSGSSYSNPERRNESSISRTNPWNSHGATGGAEVPNVFRDSEANGGFLPSKIVREQADNRYRNRMQLDRNSEISGWWYTVAIALIVITAFGAGFLIMRPLLSRR